MSKLRTRTKSRGGSFGKYDSLTNGYSAQNRVLCLQFNKFIPGFTSIFLKEQGQKVKRGQLAKGFYGPYGGKKGIIIPYRIYLPSTECGFVSISLHSSKSQHWETALYNFTMSHKYESKSKKCIGVVILRDKNKLEYFEFFWQFVEAEWMFDEVIENTIKDNYPFRKTRINKFDNRYEQKGK